MKNSLLKIQFIIVALCMFGLANAQTNFCGTWQQVGEQFKVPAMTIDRIGETYGLENKILSVTVNPLKSLGYVCVETISQDWENEAWVNMIKSEFTYDVNDYLIGVHVYMWDNDQWNDASKTEVTNNSNGHPLESLLYVWNPDSNQWELLFRDTYTYDGSGLNTEVLSEMWMMTSWMNWGHFTYTYDGNDHMIEVLDESWDFMTNAWKNAALTQFTYSGDKLIEDLYQYWENNAWVNEYNAFYTYIGNNITEVLIKDWDGGQWVNSSHRDKYYNANNQPTEELETIWENEEWVNNTRVFISYDGNNNTSEWLVKEWVNEDWVNDFRTLYTYGGVGINDHLYSEYELNISNMPNPFSAYTNISFELSERNFIEVHIFDLTGKLVISLLSTDQSAGLVELIWDGTNQEGNAVDTGIYFCTIKTGKNCNVHKISLVR